MRSSAARCSSLITNGAAVTTGMPPHCPFPLFQRRMTRPYVDGRDERQGSRPGLLTRRQLRLECPTLQPRKEPSPDRRKGQSLSRRLHTGRPHTARRSPPSNPLLGDGCVRWDIGPWLVNIALALRSPTPLWQRCRSSSQQLQEVTLYLCSCFGTRKGAKVPMAFGMVIAAWGVGVAAGVWLRRDVRSLERTPRSTLVGAACGIGVVYV